MAIIGWSKVYGFSDVSRLPILDLNGVIVEFAGHHVTPQHMFGNSNLFKTHRHAFGAMLGPAMHLQLGGQPTGHTLHSLMLSGNEGMARIQCAGL